MRPQHPPYDSTGSPPSFLPSATPPHETHDGEYVGLVSLDIGGTLAEVEDFSIGAVLADLSPLPGDAVRKVVRQTLYGASELTTDLIAQVCDSLIIDPNDFPIDHAPATLRPVPFATAVVAELSTLAPVVTLSNVTRMDAKEDDRFLWPGTIAHYPSWRQGHSKPDPRAFELVAAAHQVRIDRLLHIGDDWECDVLGATRAGAQAIWLSLGRRPPALPEDVPAGRITVAPDLVTAARCILDRATGEQPMHIRRQGR